MIETQRLILRAPEDADRDAIAALNGHPEVGAWLSGVMTREESDAMVDRVRQTIGLHGFGFWAVERKADGAVVGMTGLLIMGDDLPVPGGIELGWRMHPDAQGSGLATEAAAAARDWAFANLDVDELYAITAETNVRSQNVMKKIGMTYDPAGDFDHPRLADDHPLKRHVLFRIKRR
jgi:RimJ/RimL family protein N-acetyltransferase